MFDFQQNLPQPHIPVGEVFYTHQLWFYIFGVHNCGTNQGIMYCWPEFTANKGSDEVVSCLDKYLSSLSEDVTTLYLYSDGCPGQNKNLNVIHYLFLVRLWKFHHIQHHFPVCGHLFLPNDRDFGRTELKKKKTEHVYTPNQWYDTMRSARNRNPFKIVPVTQDMVKDIGVHLSLFFKKTVRAGKQPFNI